MPTLPVKVSYWDLSFLNMLASRGGAVPFRRAAVIEDTRARVAANLDSLTVRGLITELPIFGTDACLVSLTDLGRSTVKAAAIQTR